MNRTEALAVMRWCITCEDWLDPWYHAYGHEVHEVLGAIRSRQLATTEEHTP